MSRFNLIDERWIPVRFPDGTRQELGIGDTFRQARTIIEIEDPSPLVVGALYRLLLAILYRALEGPTDTGQAGELLRNGLPINRVLTYLENWRDRFWLFDAKYPFFQVAEYKPKSKGGRQQWRSWAAIAAEHNADNAKVLFDHTDIAQSGPIPASLAVRWLVACQTFALGGGRSDFQYTKGAPSASALMALPLGRDLSETLVFSLVPENREVLKSDLPVWERKPESVELLRAGPERAVNGFADLYTWRTRSVRLNPVPGTPQISGLLLASGVGCQTEVPMDPMVAYRIDPKRGKLPLQFQETGLWRDFDSLLPDGTRLAPAVIEHARTLTLRNLDRFPRSVAIIGQANNKAKIEFWRMERFALPEALAGKRNIRADIHQLLTDAENAHGSLRRACRSFARSILSRGGREPAKQDVTAFVGQLPLSAAFWSMLETAFHKVLAGYNIDREFDEVRREWLKSVQEGLIRAWDQHAQSVAGADVWAVRALVKAEGLVRHESKLLAEEIEELASRKEES